jgi:hypothetical protein
MTPQPSAFSDLLTLTAEGRPRLRIGIHPLTDLLELDLEGVLAAFKASQRADFGRVIREVEDPQHDLHRLFAELRAIAEREPGNPLAELPLFRRGGLEALFVDLHEHVMEHPVWRHAFFARIFAGQFDAEQAGRFARQYFNQVKNTRQCVALAIGRFHGLMALPYGVLNERLSELTQVVLAQLVADEYGVATADLAAYPGPEDLFGATTHITLYRQLFDGLGIPFEEQDVPMLHGVADNVLTQRLVAAHEAFTPLESLASVGLGMEWGVPEFFSLLLGGLIRWAWHNGVPLTQHHLEVFIAHVAYDVLHAISVLLATSLYATEADFLARIKGATNTLMAARFAMMTDLYRHVFGEDCASLRDMDLPARYWLADRRIEAALINARHQVADGTVVDADAYRRRTDTPFPFAA